MQWLSSGSLELYSTSPRLIMMRFWMIWWSFGWYDVVWSWYDEMAEVWKSPAHFPLKNPLLQTFRSVPIKITSEPGRLPNFNKKKKWRLFCINFSPNLSSASFRAHCAASAGFPDTLSISERPILQLPVIQYCNIATSNLSHFRLLYFPTWNGFIPFSQFNFLHPPLGKALQPILQPELTFTSDTLNLPTWIDFLTFG